MKGLFQVSLAAAAITAVVAGPLAHGRHMHLHRRIDHHHRALDKRALVVVTKTQEVVEIEYVYHTVYVDPNDSAKNTPEPSSFSTSTKTSSKPAETTSTSTTSEAPPPPPSSTSESSTFTTPSLPTEVIPLVVPSSTTSSTTSTTSTTSVYTPPPAPTTTAVAEPVVEAVVTTSAAAPVSTSPASGGGSGEFFYGEGTYYDCGLGSCGVTNTNDDYVVAMSHLRMTPLDGGNPNTNPTCGRKVRVYSDMAPDGVVFTVEDKCPGCAGENDLDICKSPFLAKMGTEAEGRIKIWWQWEN